jgi:hypothetical protein
VREHAYAWGCDGALRPRIGGGLGNKVLGSQVRNVGLIIMRYFVSAHCKSTQHHHMLRTHVEFDAVHKPAPVVGLTRAFHPSLLYQRTPYLSLKLLCFEVSCGRRIAWDNVTRPCCLLYSLDSSNLTHLAWQRVHVVPLGRTKQRLPLLVAYTHGTGALVGIL